MRTDTAPCDPGILRAMPPGYQISIELNSAADVLRYEQVLLEAARRCGYLPIRLPPARGGNGEFTDPYLLWADGRAVIRYYVERDSETSIVMMHIASLDQRLTDAIFEQCTPPKEGAN